MGFAQQGIRRIPVAIRMAYLDRMAMARTRGEQLAVGITEMSYILIYIGEMLRFNGGICFVRQVLLKDFCLKQLDKWFVS